MLPPRSILAESTRNSASKSPRRGASSSLLLAIVLFGGIVSGTRAGLQESPGYRALSPAGKLRGIQVYRSLLTGAEQPASDLPQVSPEGKALHQRILDRVRRQRAWEDLTTLGPEAYRYRVPATPGPTPVIRLARGRARRNAGGSGRWLPVGAGGATELPWGSWVDTDLDGAVEIEFPDGGGTLELRPRTKVLVIRTGALLERGEVRVAVPAQSSRWLQVKTDRGFLRVGPGGIVRVRPRGFAQVRGPVETLETGGGEGAE